MSPFSRHDRSLARKGIWRQRFLNQYGPAGPKLPDVTPRLKREIMRAIARGCYVTFTQNGDHSDHSWHYQTALYRGSDKKNHRGGRAADIGGGPIAKRRYYLDCLWREANRSGMQFLECFGPGQRYVKNGVFFPGQFPAHENHVHVVPDEIY